MNAEHERGIKKPRRQREKEIRWGRRMDRDRDRNEEERGRVRQRMKKQTRTVRRKRVGVVLHVYKPAADLGLLFPKNVKREEQTNAQTYTLKCSLSNHS